MTEQTRRPKILLIWGIHPNESAVTEYLAKVLKPLLEARGFDIEIVQVPEEITLHGIFKSESILKEPSIEQSFFLKYQKQSRNADYVFELHTTPDDLYLSSSGLLPLRKPRFFQARHETNQEAFENIFEGDPLIKTFEDTQGFVTVEMPAKYLPARPEWQKIHDQILRERLDPDGLSRYFAHETNLSKTKNSGILSPRIVAKIAHLIDTTVKTRLGFYHEPRRFPFRYKTDMKTALDREMQRKPELKKQLQRIMRERMRPR